MRRAAGSLCSSWRAGCSWGLPCKHVQPEILQRSLHHSKVPEGATRARPRPAPRPASSTVQGAPNQLAHRTEESSLQPNQQEQQWTPVVDKPSGLTYFWNEQTGEMPFNASLHVTMDLRDNLSDGSLHLKTHASDRGDYHAWGADARPRRQEACSHAVTISAAPAKKHRPSVDWTCWSRRRNWVDLLAVCAPFLTSNVSG